MKFGKLNAMIISMGLILLALPSTFYAERAPIADPKASNQLLFPRVPAKWENRSWFCSTNPYHEIAIEIGHDMFISTPHMHVLVEMPQAPLDQLAPVGRLLIPLRNSKAYQEQCHAGHVLLFEKSLDGIMKKHQIFSCVFVPSICANIHSVKKIKIGRPRG